MSSKKEARKTKKIIRKSQKEKLEGYIEQYRNFKDIQLLEESENVINSSKSSNEIELRLNALKFIVDNKLFNKDYFYDEIKSDYKGEYPDYTDEDFNEKIYKKREFYLTKTKKIDRKFDYDLLSKEKCSGFKHSNTQKFVKTYISPSTPYNGLLLFHGVGVGKTCSSISIAETFIPDLEKMNKKIYILLNPSIKENFTKNIFSVQKVKEGNPLSQCTRDKYLKMAGNYKNHTQLKSKVDRFINKRYKFLGYITFANMIEKMEARVDSLTKNPELRKKLKTKNIKEMFDNSVMIIDEAHNIKENEGGMKVLPPILENVVSVASNMKLILLSATPMFDNPTEIIFLLNLLLKNDNKPPLKVNDIFDKNYDFVKDDTGRDIGKDLLIYKSRGYISYMRGENPLSFPLRIDPNPKLLIDPSDFPIVDVSNERINNRLQHLKIVGCVMKDKQLEVYNKMEETKFGAFNLPGMMTSNMVFPGQGEDLVGTSGFNSVFSKSKGTYTIKKNIEQDFLDAKKIGSYSSKISTILENIKNSKGIIFIYSQFIWGGLMPLAMALEYNGYTRLGGNLLNGPRKDKVKVNGKYDAKYIIISGSKELSYNSYENYLKLEHENVNGEQVKIILGSETAAEGLDFKYIREVHILDPWHHLNKIEQIVGRGIRFCSHKSLPIEERNVTVNMYASIKSNNPSKDLETVDLKIYRTAENKSVKMGAVEYELKRSAVDCNLNIESNKLVGPFWNKEIDIINSKGEKQRINLQDKDNSRLCNYKECDFKCYNEMPENLEQKDINNDTFNIQNIQDQIYDSIEIIRELYKMDIIYDLNDIITHDLIKYKLLDEDVIIMTMDYIIKNKIEIADNFNRKGCIIYRGGYYIFEPTQLKKQKMTIRDLKRPLSVKYNRINITNLINNTENNVVEEPETNIMSIINYNLESLYEQNSTSLKNKEKQRNKYDIKVIEKSRNIIEELREYEKQLDIGILYLPSIKKESLLKKLLVKPSGEMSHEERIIYKLLDPNILYYKRDVYYKDSINYSGEEKIWGYKVIKKGVLKYYFMVDSKSFREANNEERLLIKKSFNKKDHIEAAQLIGYLEEKADGSINLKIRDKSGQATKKTQVKTGSICGNDGMKKERIYKYLDNTINFKDKTNTYFNKELLCKQLEIYLLLNNKEKYQGNRWYYTAEENLEYELGKK